MLLESHLSCDVFNCLLLYADCTGEYITTGWSVVWNVRGDMIDFVVSAVTTGWVAIGFSETNLMVIKMYVYCIGYKYKWLVVYMQHDL